MKKILIILALITPVVLAVNWMPSSRMKKMTKISVEGETVRWHTFKEAQEATAKEPKKMLVDVYTKWCGPCKMMMKNTFSNPIIARYINKHYYPVKFNAEGPELITWKGVKYQNPTYDATRTGRNGTHQLTSQIAVVEGRIAYPTLVYIDENLDILTPVQGYMQPHQLEPILHFFAEDHYKEQEYGDFVASNFQSEL